VYAIFETGGKQYKAGKGDIVFVEKLDGEPGKQVSFDALVVADGDNVQIGTPVVKGAKVRAKIVEHGKEKKVVIFKYKAKSNYRRKQGHRQPFTKIRITSIGTAKEKEAAEE
jgi:large subunit ribosomal protein L21